MKMAVLVFALAIASCPLRSELIVWKSITANVPTSPKVFRAGAGTLQIAGELDGATLTLEWTVIADEWAAVEPCIDITQGLCNFPIGQGRLRVVVSGGGPSLNATAAVSSIGAGVAVAFSGGGAGSSAVWLEDATAVEPGMSEPALSLSGGFVRLPGSQTVNGDMTDHAITWDAPSTGVVAALGFSDNIGTWGGVRVEVGAHRWTFRREGPFGSRSHVGLVDQRGIDTASLRPHTSFDVGVGSDFGLTGSLVKEVAILTWDSAGVRIRDGLTVGFPRSSGPPVPCTMAIPGHLYFDDQSAAACLCDGTDWVNLADGVTVCP